MPPTSTVRWGASGGCGLGRLPLHHGAGAVRGMVACAVRPVPASQPNHTAPAAPTAHRGACARSGPASARGGDGRPVADRTHRVSGLELLRPVHLDSPLARAPHRSQPRRRRDPVIDDPDRLPSRDRRHRDTPQTFPTRRRWESDPPPSDGSGLTVTDRCVRVRGVRAAAAAPARQRPGPGPRLPPKAPPPRPAAASGAAATAPVAGPVPQGPGPAAS